jgi:hypothetical protein
VKCYIGRLFVHLRITRACINYTNTTRWWLGEKRHGFYLLTLDLSTTISTNLVTSGSTPLFRLYNEMTWPSSIACTFERSWSFAAVPLQVEPPRLSMSGSVQFMSYPFLETTSSSTSAISGPPLDRPFMSHLLDRPSSVSSYVGLQPSLHLTDAISLSASASSQFTQVVVSCMNTSGYNHVLPFMALNASTSSSVTLKSYKLNS